MLVEDVRFDNEGNRVDVGLWWRHEGPVYNVNRTSKDRDSRGQLSRYEMGYCGCTCTEHQQKGLVEAHVTLFPDGDGSVFLASMCNHCNSCRRYGSDSPHDY